MSDGITEAYRDERRIKAEERKKLGLREKRREPLTQEQKDAHLADAVGVYPPVNMTESGSPEQEARYRLEEIGFAEVERRMKAQRERIAGLEAERAAAQKAIAREDGWALKLAEALAEVCKLRGQLATARAEGWREGLEEAAGRIGKLIRPDQTSYYRAAMWRAKDELHEMVREGK